MDRSVIGKIGTGQSVKVRGRVATITELVLVLEDAELAESGPDTSLRFTSEELAKGALKDPDALYKRCKGKTVYLTGKVVASKPDPVFGVIVELQGAENVKVFCDLENTAAVLFKNGFAPGEQVKFACDVGVVDDAKKTGKINVTLAVPIHRPPTAEDATKRK